MNSLSTGNLAGAQDAGPEMADERVPDEDRHRPEHGPAGGPAHRLHADREQDHADDERVRRLFDHVLHHDRVVDGRVQAGREGNESGGCVVPGQRRAPRAESRRRLQEHQRRAEPEHGGEELLVIDDDADRARQVEAPNDRERCDQRGESGAQHDDAVRCRVDLGRFLEQMELVAERATADCAMNSVPPRRKVGAGASELGRG